MTVLMWSEILQKSMKKIPEHDILLAGFPCQAFFLRGHKKGFEDARGTLFLILQEL